MFVLFSIDNASQVIGNASQVIGIAIFGIYGTRIQWRRRREREKTLHVLSVDGNPCINVRCR